jgi:hypothetical protein
VSTDRKASAAIARGRKWGASTAAAVDPRHRCHNQTTAASMSGSATIASTPCVTPRRECSAASAPQKLATASMSGRFAPMRSVAVA